MYDLPLRHVPEAVVGYEQFAPEPVFSGGTGAPNWMVISHRLFSGVWGSRVETTEAVAPVLITRRNLNRQWRPRPATWRVGTTYRNAVISRKDFLLFLSAERVLNPARGRYGGGDGAAGRIHIKNCVSDLPAKEKFG